MILEAEQARAVQDALARVRARLAVNLSMSPQEAYQLEREVLATERERVALSRWIDAELNAGRLRGAIDIKRETGGKH